MIHSITLVMNRIKKNRQRIIYHFYHIYFLVFLPEQIPPPRNFPCHHLPSSVTKYLITISLIILIIVLIVSLFSKTMLINQLNLIVIIFLVRGILIFFFLEEVFITKQTFFGYNLSQCRYKAIYKRNANSFNHVCIILYIFPCLKAALCIYCKTKTPTLLGMELILSISPMHCNCKTSPVSYIDFDGSRLTMEILSIFWGN